ncbi:MAG: serine/threonine protein kinase [Deltaproteobacteria bacterium]|nr:serine/threonine protein kinase [Deltaproteobacteria bacterium]
MSDRRCPSCGRRFAADINFCPIDGEPLPSQGNALGTILDGQIELEQVCGEGAMGTVYRAYQHSMDRYVAVKIMRPELTTNQALVRRFRREARAAAKLSHPSIITVYLVGDTDEGLPFIAMEYVEGITLEALCEQHAPLPVARAFDIATQIASALTEAHEHGVIHRDLKPGNILLSSKRSGRDEIKVVDFGIAKISEGDEESQLTQTGAVFGTPYYLSPEQASGAKVDQRSDVYSLGVVLYHMLTGALPFRGSSSMEVLLQHIKELPPPPRTINPALSPAVENVILTSLEKDPQRRYQSAQAFADAMAQATQHLAPGASLHLPPTALPEAGPSELGASAPGDWLDQASLSGERPLLAPRRTAAFRHTMVLTACIVLGGAIGATAYLRRPSPEHRAVGAVDGSAKAGNASSSAAAQPAIAPDRGLPSDLTTGGQATAPDAGPALSQDKAGQAKGSAAATKKLRKKKARARKRRRPERHRPTQPQPTTPTPAPIDPLPIPP